MPRVLADTPASVGPDLKLLWLFLVLPLLMRLQFCKAAGEEVGSSQDSFHLSGQRHPRLRDRGTGVFRLVSMPSASRIFCGICAWQWRLQHLLRWPSGTTWVLFLSVIPQTCEIPFSVQTRLSRGKSVTSKCQNNKISPIKVCEPNLCGLWVIRVRGKPFLDLNPTRFCMCRDLNSFFQNNYFSFHCTFLGN